MNKHTRPPEIR